MCARETLNTMLNLESVQVFDKQLLGSVSAEVVPLVFKSLKHFTKQTNQKKKKSPRFRSFISLHSWLNLGKTGQSGLEKKAEWSISSVHSCSEACAFADRQFRFWDKLLLGSYSSALFCLKQNHYRQMPESRFS